MRLERRTRCAEAKRAARERISNRNLDSQNRGQRDTRRPRHRAARTQNARDDAGPIRTELPLPIPTKNEMRKKTIGESDETAASAPPTDCKMFVSLSRIRNAPNDCRIELESSMVTIDRIARSHARALRTPAFGA